MSQHVVKLHIVDFVGSTCLESSQNDVKFFFRQSHSKVVKDGAESREVDEARSALVFVLEVGFDQQTSVFHISA